jgi:hypothetical protein
LIIEVESGTPRPSDKVQLMLYLWAIGKTYSRFRGVPFEGLLIYKTHEIEISALEIDESFIENFSKFMKEILQGEPDPKYPSKHECRFCKLLIVMSAFMGDCRCRERVKRIGSFAGERKSAIENQVMK